MINKLKYKDVAVIVLAAGKGTRLNMPNGKNKTVLEIKGKPMILRTIEGIEALGVAQIVVVVGHGKDSVESILGNRVDYAIQTKRLGTGHAALCGLKKVNSAIKNVVVVYGDDSHSYHSDIYHSLIDACNNSEFDMALTVMILNNPFGLGRIIRDENGNVVRVTEEKNASIEEKLIKEVNTGAYCFKVEFATKYLHKIGFNTVKHEKYLTDIIEIAVANHKSIATVELEDVSQWQGVNTIDDLMRVNRLVAK